MGKRELVPLLNLSSWCLVEQLFLAVPRCCLRFVIVVFPDHTHLLFFISLKSVCRQIVLFHDCFLFFFGSDKLVKRCLLGLK